MAQLSSLERLALGPSVGRLSAGQWPHVCQCLGRRTTSMWGWRDGGADASSPAVLAHPLMPKSAGELLGKTLIWRPIHKTADWNVGEPWLQFCLKDSTV